MTTDCSSAVVSELIRTSMTALPDTASSTVLKPSEENSRKPSEGTVMEYFPSMSVTVPFLRSPLWTTPTPGNVVPAASLTVPLTRTFCPNSGTTSITLNANNINLLISLFLFQHKIHSFYLREQIRLRHVIKAAEPETLFRVAGCSGDGDFATGIITYT